MKILTAIVDAWKGLSIWTKRWILGLITAILGAFIAIQIHLIINDKDPIKFLDFLGR